MTTKERLRTPTRCESGAGLAEALERVNVGVQTDAGSVTQQCMGIEHAVYDEVIAVRGRSQE